MTTSTGLSDQNETKFLLGQSLPMIGYKHKYRAPWQDPNIYLVRMDGEDWTRLLCEVKTDSSTYSKVVFENEL